MACVYWIRKPIHTNILTDGYIGFTSKAPQKRFNEHIGCANMRAGRSPKLEKAIQKYGREGLIVQTLCVGDNEYCYALEKRLRPAHNIGWNLAIGGEKVAIGRIVSAATRKKLSDSRKNIRYSKEVCKKISLAAKGNQRKKGVKLSDESKERIRLAGLGRKATPQARENMRQAALRRKNKVLEVANDRKN